MFEASSVYVQCVNEGAAHVKIDQVFRWCRPGRVQRISEKALVLQDECLPKGTCPTLIFTCPFSNQFKLKESQNRVFLPPILADYWTLCNFKCSTDINICISEYSQNKLDVFIKCLRFLLIFNLM